MSGRFIGAWPWCTAHYRLGGCRHPTLKQQGMTIPNQGHLPCGCWCCAHSHLTLRVKAHEASHINKTNREAVAGGVQAVACAMHYEHVSIRRLDIKKYTIDYVPINRLGINKCLSQAAQEVKPEASSLDNPWSSLRSGVTRG